MDELDKLKGAWKTQFTTHQQSKEKMYFFQILRTAKEFAGHQIETLVSK